MKGNLEKIFDEGRHILEKQKIRDEGKENFNIFKILRIERKEVNLHSYFLYELINPKAKHGLGLEFLKIFKEEILEKIDSKQNKKEKDQLVDGLVIDEDIKVEREHCIAKNKKRIDFVIETNDWFVAIEMKIDAKDSPNQLKDYYEYSKLKNKKFKVFYLTKNGLKASEESSKGCCYTCISFETHILNFIKKCIEKSSMFPKMRESLIQYKESLEGILNVIGGEMEKELLELMLKDNNMEIMEKIVDLYSEAKEEEYRKYLNEIFERIEEINKKNNCEKSKIEETGEYKGIVTQKIIKNHNITIDISIDEDEDDFLFYFDNLNEEQSLELSEKLGFEKNEDSGYFKYLNYQRISKKIRDDIERNKLTEELLKEYLIFLGRVTDYLEKN